ncbi:MAG: transposase domain-containing protein [Phocaeicola sp.]
MSRKNYLFSKNDKGAEDNAIFYSLLESCEIAGVNKLEWLTRTLEKIKQDSTEEEIKKLLPKNYRTD